MNETYKFLKENTQVNYVSTINDGKPSCRPFGDPIMVDNKIYVITNKHKNVSKQIEKNNNVCIVAYDDEKWIRINCELIDDSQNMKVKQAVIDALNGKRNHNYLSFRAAGYHSGEIIGGNVYFNSL